ncbi:MAG: cyclic pyranopterin monophosphate synthase MoaC [Aigarchaeota archaeon]|nr:cyclic pyranopterin monophosphate synthase MoaC [Aigarchaeota archaeon]MDW8092218.1 cyclic pyranopterin monophosphate synthase MoaC [Nitrososphaerota archaeon]
MRQVDVSEKRVIRREATAQGFIRLRRSTLELIRSGVVEKGDPVQLAQIGGVIGAKSVSSLLPLCHQLKIESVQVSVELLDKDSCIRVVARVIAHEKTGVEMEALAAVSIALLNIWDLVKIYEKDSEGQYPETEIFGIRVLEKVKGD